MVCFRVGNISYEIGTASFLYSFFSTVVYRLEKGRWGSRFPMIMNELYQGQLSFEKILVAKQELKQIKKELSFFCRIRLYGILMTYQSNHHGKIISAIPLQV